MKTNHYFWKTKRLDQLDPLEWEALCDGCGKCCVNKLEDEETGEILSTNIACKLFDDDSCACKNYQKRADYVPACQKLSPKKVERLSWLPQSCAYRLVANDEDLPDWHHLICGDKKRVHTTNNSVRRRVVSELNVREEDYEDFIVDWLD